MFSLRFVVTLSLLLLLAGGFFMIEKQGDTIAVPVHQEVKKGAVPALDKEIPAGSETATFALG